MLVLAAFPPELAALDPGIERATVGVGLVDAALGAARVLATRKPREVVLVGTVGAYPGSGLGIGDVVRAEKVLLAAPSGALIEAISRRIDLDRSDPNDLTLSARSVIVATTLAVTTDDTVASALEASTGAHVEHLEAFAVARACETAGVPFSAIFGVANIVGARGREEWRANHEAAAAAACRLLRSRPTMPSPA
ncbi:MAG TPA: hypothetical protein VGH28_03855 [Polyangiaceae bacterium]